MDLRISALAGIAGPDDLRGLDAAELAILAREIRDRLVDHVSRTGGHLGPNLGVVELTIALHRVFRSPHDRLLFDTGHQAYVHKMLTGRTERFDRLRQRGGLSGYPCRAESPHDLIENSHASTALGYADGLARGYAIRGEQRRVVAVVGDGALTGGMAWEALNNIGAARRSVIVVLNDNGRSYGPTVGGLAEHLTRLRIGDVPGPNLFENLGLHYLGPVAGHDLDEVETALRTAAGRTGPTVVHCVTRKGAGHGPAERDDIDRFHAVAPARPPAVAAGAHPPAPTWTAVFGAALADLGDARTDLVALTAAMLHPVGLAPFARRHPDRVIDVGIAEQHAAACAAGLSLAGMHPVVAVYATFLNRAFDQILLDVALHRCGVTFVADRAGVTGEDGPSHNGVWDMSLFGVVPGMRIAAPRDAGELGVLLREAVEVRDGPTVLRFPKGTVGPGLTALCRYGRADLLYGAGGRDADVLLVGVGATAGVCLAAADLLSSRGISATVVDPRWPVPVDPALVEIAASHRVVVTVEDNSRRGGVGTLVTQAVQDAGLHTPVRTVGVAARFLAHGSRSEVLAGAGITPESVAVTAESALESVRKAAR